MRLSDNMALQTNRVIEGDSLDKLDSLPENSVHAIVTDPPYGLAFMGRSWDDFEPQEYQEWCEQWAKKALRVLKPGGHMLAFSGNRTHHRMFAGVEDAGFEVRDCITWHYGSGFPKNTDTQLKPSTEFVVMARKPCGGSVKDCYEEHGTGYLGIDECRITTDEDTSRPTSAGNGLSGESTFEYSEDKTTGGHDGSGRYPSNLLLDDVAAEQLDEQTGELESGRLTAEMNNTADSIPFDTTHGEFERKGQEKDYQKNSGGASRFFYCAKANKSERTLNGKIDNAHPTVKPIDLMEWLVKLVTRDGQIVLDPFCGSGTTLRAAKNLGREFIGIEQQAKWCDVSRARCGLTPENPEMLTDENQSALQTYTSG